MFAIKPRLANEMTLQEWPALQSHLSLPQSTFAVACSAQKLYRESELCFGVLFQYSDKESLVRMSLLVYELDVSWCVGSFFFQGSFEC